MTSKFWTRQHTTAIAPEEAIHIQTTWNRDEGVAIPKCWTAILRHAHPASTPPTIDDVIQFWTQFSWS